jgi:hypothetical protein
VGLKPVALSRVEEDVPVVGLLSRTSGIETDIRCEWAAASFVRLLSRTRVGLRLLKLEQFAVVIFVTLSDYLLEPEWD